MPHFSKIHIQGFRRLKNVELPLGPLNVLIGPNGAGKTSLLDAFRLLSSSAQGKLREQFSVWGGIAEQLSSSAGKREIRVELDLARDGNLEPLSYSLALEPTGIAHRISEERLSEHRIAGKPPFLHFESINGAIKFFNRESKHLEPAAWDLVLSESTLCQVPRTFPDPEKFKQRLMSVELFHHLDIGPQAPVRLPQAMQPATHPGTNGEYLLSCLYSLREQNPHQFETIEDTFKVAFPGFQRLGFPPVAAGKIAMTWHEEHLRDPVYTHQLSEGTLRFIWLTTLLQSQSLPAVTLIDEPEISLHPQLLGLLADLFRDASRRTQLIVATHSERLIQHLKPEEIIVCGIGADGFANAKPAAALDLQGWMQDFALDELWRMGKFEERE